jgi:hypothetical protein
VDGGVGTFLSSGPQLSHPSEVDDRWVKLARDNQARIQVPTLRNVDKRPDPSFVKAYTHNGSFTTITRGTSCRAASPMTPVKERHAGRPLSRPTT